MIDFDPVGHVYRLDGAVVPSVTYVLGQVFRQRFWGTDWHRDRGTAVHACAAMIARGVEFDFDPVIAGQVAACRKWFADYKPTVRFFEMPVCSARWGYAGTFDLIIGPKPFNLIDWKASVTPVARYQLGAYALAYEEMTGVTIERGWGVELREDGTHRAGPIYKMKEAKRDWLNVLTVFRFMERDGLLVKEEAA